MAALRDANLMTIAPKVDTWRPGDQKVFVANIDKLKQCLNWEPKIDPRAGLNMLMEWSTKNRDLFEKILN